MMVEPLQVLEEHRANYGRETGVSSAPGRVNLIGEHTDYTGGFVMPMAIEFRTATALTRRPEGRAIFRSVNFAEEVGFALDAAGWKATGHWSDYPLGVLWAILQRGIRVEGFAMTLGGDVPLGAGLSSSASVEVSVAVALLAHAGVQLGLSEVATLCRKAENEFVGAKSGIMDQFIVAGGVKDRAMLLDCRSLEYDLLPLPQEVKVVICNSMVKHQVSTGEYGDRRDEVEAGQAVLRRELGLELLRDASLRDLEACREKMSPASYHRCRHIITENGRVVKAGTALRAGDVAGFGELMQEAHSSFRDDFAASCPEVDKLVALAGRLPGCYGARITGGGFGGCTVNLVRATEAEAFGRALRSEYLSATGIEADWYVCVPSDGALAQKVGEETTP